MKLSRPTAFFLPLLASFSLHGQTLQVTIRDGDGAAVSGAVAEVLLPDNLRGRFQTSADARVDQVDKEFIPSISTIVAGSRVSFPNSDDILHHVYSFSPARTFNIPLYGRGENDDYFENFPDPGVVEIGCNIHDWMLAYIYVSASDRVGISDENGTLAIDALPAGSYQVRIWHPRLAEGEQGILRPTTIATGTAQLEVAVELERDRRLRRAPSANRRRYR